MKIAGNEPQLGLQQPLHILNRLPKGRVCFQSGKVAQMLTEPDSVLSEQCDRILKMSSHGQHRFLAMFMGEAVS